MERRSGFLFRSERLKAVGVFWSLALILFPVGVSVGQGAGATTPTPFAQDALDAIVGDLKQEIAAGSVATPVGGNTTYAPKAPATMVPAAVGSTRGFGIENLLKRSAYNEPFYPVTNYDALASKRAADLPTAVPTSNGRFISSTRWNAPWLLAKAYPASDASRKPVAEFVVPDWILTSRDGSNPTTWDPGLKTSPSDGSSVVGRYAYTIYDEGGLLDITTAGSKSDADPTWLAYKESLAAADLTQLGLTQAQIDALIDARDLSPVTDRQSLIDLFTGALPTDSAARAGLQNALPYIGNFSRALNQPAYAPDPNRPRVLDLASGGNYSYGDDDVINPSFLNVRVGSAFSRRDGSVAIVGEPLVKRRFPLSYLAWLTYEGPSSSASAATQTAMLNAGISQAIIDLGTASNIEAWFGLTWNSGKWVYRSGANSPIKTLGAITGREPDFFELLKASINVGSVGKAYASSGSPLTPEGYQQQRDNSVDAQIMQIAANIIDQSDVDGYPTTIVFNDGSLFGGRDLEYRGVEDLPYLYRMREGKVMTRDSVPAVSLLPIADGSTPLTDPGEGVFLLQPEIWNPHVMTSSSATNPRPSVFRLVAATMDPITDTPTQYRLGIGWRPDSGSILTWQSPTPTALNATMSFAIPANRLDLFREPTLLIKPGIPNGSSLVGPATYQLISEITPAYQYGANGVADNGQYTGIPLGTVPMAFTATFAAGGINNSNSPIIPAATTAGIAPAGYVYYPTSGNATSFPYVTYRLQCNINGQWVTYDEKYATAPTASSFDTPYRWSENDPGTDRFRYAGNKTFYRIYNQPWSAGAVGSGLAVTAFDPRSGRFGMSICGSNGRYYQNTCIPLTSRVRYWEDSRPPWNRFGWAAATSSGTSASMMSAAAQNAVMTARPDEYRGAPFFSGNTGDYTGPTVGGWSPGGLLAGISPGMFVQNTPASVPSKRTAYDAFTAFDTYPQYFADPDGVIRRGMSGHVPANGNTAPALAPAPGFPSGLPLKAAYQFDGSGVATPITTGPNANDHLSRPLILNRPFRSVAELGSVFSDTPWRNLDFSTPETGGTSLLDVFCIEDSAGLVTGRVNLNTRQAPVLRTILAGAYTDELNPLGNAVTHPISATDAEVMSSALVARTTSTNAASGPMFTLSDLVGRWDTAVTVSGAVDGSLSYHGFSNDLSSALSDDTDRRIERYREAAIRALSNAGQTRVWNLLIDIVVQEGEYPASATSLGDFTAQTEERYWLHIAIDRYTGEVLDQSMEAVTEDFVELDMDSVHDTAPSGAVVGALKTSGADLSATYTYALVSGEGDDGNAAFTISGDQLQTTGSFDYFGQSIYYIRLEATDQNGHAFQQRLAVHIAPGPYTQWKIDQFGEDANNPAIAGDNVDLDYDGIVSLIEYATGKAALTADAPPIAARPGEGGYELEYQLSSTATDVTAHVYASETLVDPDGWSRTGVTEKMLSDDGEIQLWKATMPFNASGRMFFRLEVTPQ